MKLKSTITVRTFKPDCFLNLLINMMSDQKLIYMFKLTHTRKDETPIGDASRDIMVNI